MWESFDTETIFARELAQMRAIGPPYVPQFLPLSQAHAQAPALAKVHCSVSACFSISAKKRHRHYPFFLVGHMSRREL